MTNTIYRDVELVPQTDPETATDDTNTTVHAKPPNKCRNFITSALKTLILILATFAALAGLYVVLRFKRVHCLIGGILLIVTGVVMILVEVPSMCTSVKWADPIRELFQKIRAWQKIIVYTMCGVGVITLCQTMSAIVGSGAIFAACFFSVIACCFNN